MSTNEEPLGQRNSFRNYLDPVQDHSITSTLASHTPFHALPFPHHLTSLPHLAREDGDPAVMDLPDGAGGRTPPDAADCILLTSRLPAEVLRVGPKTDPWGDVTWGSIGGCYVGFTWVERCSLCTLGSLGGVHMGDVTWGSHGQARVL